MDMLLELESDIGSAPSVPEPAAPRAEIRTSAPETGRDECRSPLDLFGEFFVDVQTSGIFFDSKTFVDATALFDRGTILSNYSAEKDGEGFRLLDFVKRHFDLSAPHPAEETAFIHPDIRGHIAALWPRLTREPAPGINIRRASSLLELGRDYVVPGGRFNEIYYWDSYFTMMGLIEDGHGELAASMARNFSDLIDRHGHVPNGHRTYYLSRSQPPFFFKMVELLSPSDPGGAWRRFLPHLEAEHRYWMAGAEHLAAGDACARVVRLRDGSLLNRFWDDRDHPREESYREDLLTARCSGRDPRQVYRDLRAAAESGWDFSSRWCADPARLSTIETTSLLPIDLNALLYGLEQAIALGSARAGDVDAARRFERLAAGRRRAIDRHLWCERAGHYVDFRWTRHERRADLTAATAMPLFVGLSTPAQAARVAQALASGLLTARGLVTTRTRSGQQWDFPNGWAPLQWIAIDGLRRYALGDLAETIADRWISCVDKVYGETGRLVEKYDVVEDRPGGGGEYDAQCGFGWTNGVHAKLSGLRDARRNPSR
ncbi:MAG: alpha,alpha-trehalase TreF [Burkholderiaceae bacterium]